MKSLGPGVGGNKIRESDNQLAPPQPIPGMSHTPSDMELYTEEKERYLGDLCQTKVRDVRLNEPLYSWHVLEFAVSRPDGWKLVILDSDA